MLVLQPHEDLKNRILQVKKEFATKFEAPQAERGKPNIPLVRFKQLQLLEPRLVNRFKMIAMAIPPFKVELRNFGSFPAHSIYIDVESKAALEMVGKSLRPAQQLMKANDQKPHFYEHAHITVARNLLPWQFEKSWLEYSHKQFTGRFIAKDMLLLRKPEGMLNFQVIHRFEFLNMPVLTTQGALF
ncbi:hypothetical protein EXU57_17545 [Segetibacter sp. 3557_3]|nr:hypothetical protein EXU57_17545 [Segetibacter sp. 3557_3]